MAKRMKRTIVIILAVILSLALWWWLEPLSSKNDVEPRYSTFTLDNGMQVVVFPNRTVPAVSHMVWYRVGAADDPPGKSGLAHFFEHLMFKGTEAVPSGEFSKTIARYGGKENAFTGPDYTAYYQKISREHLELVMRMEADRMQGLTLEDSVIVPERDVVLEERRMRVDNKPDRLLQEQMRATLFPAHPYGIPTIGKAEEIAALTREDAEAFYRQYYRPNNAILIVSGDISVEELRPLAEQYYGAVPAGEPVVRERAVEGVHVSGRRVELSHVNAWQPVWMRMVAMPSLLYDAHGALQSAEEPTQAYALLLLSHVLGGGDTSRLYRSLVMEQGVAVTASAYYDDFNLGPSTLYLSAIPAQGTSLSELEEAVGLEIQQVQDSGVTEEELQRAQRQLKIAAVYAREGLQTQGYIAGQLLTMGGELSYLDDWDRNIESVTVQDVQAAAQALLVPQRWVTGTLVPETQGDAP